MAAVLSFFRPAASVRGDWSTQEVAEFYRVEAALVQAGVSVLVDRGVSDEGDPWFVFCRAVDGEVIVHFARTAGNYLIAAESIGRTLSGSDFRRLLSEFVSLNPTLIPMLPARGKKLLLHPASLLAAVVATALYHMSGSEAVANTVDPTAVDPSHSIASSEGEIGGTSEFDRKWSDLRIAAAAVAMIALAAADFSQSDYDGSLIASIIPDVPVELISTTVHSVISNAPAVSHDANLLSVSLLNISDANGSLEQASDPIDSYNATSIAAKVLPPAAPGQIVVADAATGSKTSADHVRCEESCSLAGDNTTAAPSELTAANKMTIAPPAPDAKVADNSSREKPVQGSSTPDHPVATSGEFQNAASFVTNELGTLNRSVVQINLTDSMSVQEVINFATNDVFGRPSALFSNGATASVTDVDTFSTHNSVASSSASPTPSATRSSSSAYPMFGSEASATLDIFVRLNNFEVVTSDRNVVLFDTNPADLASPDLVVKTWSMNDGSTITIVGIVPQDSTHLGHLS